MHLPALFLALLAAASVPAFARPAADFDPATVAESRADLPPFPFFEHPEGLRPLREPKDANRAFDRVHMIAGERVTAIEGKVWNQRYRLAGVAGAREYSPVEFHRNYADAITALGGVEVSRVQYTPPVLNAFGGRAEVDRHYLGTCASHGCENHTWLIRQGGREYWIQVSTGGIPLHGEVVVVEKKAMESRLEFLDAAQMGQAIAAEGRVALNIEFDVDRASLRPAALPVIAEILKLLQAQPALKLSIEGHTDATGSAARNRELSAQRAETVRAVLIAFGVDPARLSSAGFGPDRPLVAETDEASRQRNRRVELVRQ